MKTRKERIEEIVPHGQFCTEFHCYCKTRRIKIEIVSELIQEEVEPLREALEKIQVEALRQTNGLSSKYNILDLVRESLKGEKPDPSRPELIELVKEAYWFHTKDDSTYEWDMEHRKRLKSCIEKLEGE